MWQGLFHVSASYCFGAAPLLHEKLDQCSSDDLPLLHRVMLELERDRLVAELDVDFDRDRASGRLSRLPEIIKEARAALAGKAERVCVIVVIDTNTLVQLFGTRSVFRRLAAAV